MEFKNKLYLAPMAGFTDAPMRRLCRRHGCDVTVSEMVSAKAMCFKDEKTGVLAAITEGEGESIIQLFGHEPESMSEAVKMVAEGSFVGCSYAVPPAAIDINMGCPVKKIVTSGDGSALMKDTVTASKVARSCVKAAEAYNMPVTVKIRAGWDNNSINAPEFAKMLADCGISCIAIHARTREQMYAPKADWSIIKKVREALPHGFPLVGNGDITCGEDALRMIRETDCDSVMIGRGALGNPWIFEEIKALLNGEEYTPPTTEERLCEALRLISEIVEEKGEEQGGREARGRVAHFIKGLRGAAVARDRINHAVTYSEVEEIIKSEIDIGR